MYEMPYLFIMSETLVKSILVVLQTSSTCHSVFLPISTYQGPHDDAAGLKLMGTLSREERSDVIFIGVSIDRRECRFIDTPPIRSLSTQEQSLSNVPPSP